MPGSTVIIASAAGAFLCAYVLHAIAMRVFPRLGLMDFPERYGLARARIPYPTGILSSATFLVFLLCSFELTLQTGGLMLAVALLAGVSFVDDRRQLPAWVRIAVQILIALVIFATGSRIYTITNPLDALGLAEFIKLDAFTVASPFGPLPVLSGIFTILWLGLTMNALNWFDGIPGQVSTISVIGFTMLGLLALSARVDQPDVALMAFMLAGIAAACLLFDFPPPRALMGDSGAMFFGLMLGVLGIYEGGKVATAFLALGIPLVDAFLVALRRVARGKSPLKGDLDHLHHRLLRKGWPASGVIALTAGIGALFGVAALFMDTAQKGIAVVVLVAAMLFLTKYSTKE